MSVPQDGYQKEVESLLSTLAKYKELIARGYGARTGADFEPDEESPLRLLRSLGLVRPTGENQFRLSKPLRDLINRGINRHHIRDINVNLGAYRDALLTTVDDYLAAKKQKDDVLLDAAVDEVVSVFYEIGDFFADASAEIDQQVKLVIGNQAYGQERIRVIKAHLAKLDRLQEAHEAITHLLEDELYNEDSLLSDERIKLFARTLRYIDQVKSTHQEIRTVLHCREIREKRTQCLRQLDAFLRENPTAPLDKASAHASEHAYFCYAIPLTLRSFVNFDSYDQDWLDFYHETIGALAEKSPSQREQFTRPDSGPTKENTLVRKKEETFAIRIINDLIKHVYTPKTAVSAIQFKQKHTLGNYVSAPYWLYISRIHTTQLLRSPKSKLARLFRILPVYAKHELTAGNRTVIDVLIAHNQAPIALLAELKNIRAKEGCKSI